MDNIFNIYCDESCHLENDNQKAMTLGAFYCPLSKRVDISKRLTEIKLKHKLTSNFEIKWSKISNGKIRFYLDIIDYFFDDDDCHFRGLVIPNKALINHEKYSQTHDDWYYKMYFNLLKTILSPRSEYNIFIDIKDTLGNEKVNKLHDVLCNNIYDFKHNIIKQVKRIQSHESILLQISDLLIGALSYMHRGLQGNQAKISIIDRIKERSKYSLEKSTLLQEDKFNLLIWQEGWGNK